ncbi:DsbA family protein [Leekyejoonella antrihumi]|uniref:Thioredoxin-like fold domain-containing protein n=1 Tax=Leekyejoonella antrihumi TaxID=1660198 RepID=A0A563DWS6_9MICO|nr:thioredoxin domain-containing protein [Leekyejoonella antrihumi]TWP34383.1 hypothetical protein FGL98_17555 [Leekyejoonella antrihumi]
MPRPDPKEKLDALKPKEGPSKAIIAAIVVVVLVLGGFAALIVSQTGGSDSTKGTALPKGAIADGNGIVAYPGVAKKGVPTVDLYEDFQCPICNELEKANGSDIYAMGKSGQIKLVYHMMTFLDQNEHNTASALAANAGYCAADAGKFPEYHKANYAGQPAQEGAGYTVADVKKFGRQAGITGSALKTFDSCVDANKYAKYVQATETRSGKNGVNSTPSVFINGKQLDQNSQDYSSLLSQPGSFPKVLKAHS